MSDTSNEKLTQQSTMDLKGHENDVTTALKGLGVGPQGGGELTDGLIGAGLAALGPLGVAAHAAISLTDGLSGGPSNNSSNTSHAASGSRYLHEIKPSGSKQSAQNKKLDPVPMPTTPHTQKVSRPSIFAHERLLEKANLARQSLLNGAARPLRVANAAAQQVARKVRELKQELFTTRHAEEGTNRFDNNAGRAKEEKKKDAETNRVVHANPHIIKPS